MSYWVEIHCDVDPRDRAGRGCRSDVNENPAAKASKLQVANTFAVSDALNRGWKRYRGLWACPNCQRHGLKART